MEAESTNREWIEHFKHNRGDRINIAWNAPYRISPEEAEAISDSIKAFQLGESSDGAGFKKRAEQYAVRFNDPDYVVANRLFIEEEQHHSAMLGRFMQQQGLPFATFDWTDFIFRKLRKLAGLDLCISVLISAEIIALVYYKALRDATESLTLKQICRQILGDEVQHILFQTAALRNARQKRSRFSKAFSYGFHRMFMWLTVLVVWRQYGKTLKAGHYTFTRFLGENLCEMEDAILLMKGDWSGVRMRSNTFENSHLPVPF